MCQAIFKSIVISSEQKTERLFATDTDQRALDVTHHIRL
jgi:hypothetical protein